MKKILLGILVLTNVALKSNDLMESIIGRDPKQLETIIKKYGKVEPGKPSPLEIDTPYPNTPLQLAVIMNNRKMVDMLLEANVNINGTNSRGETALTSAVKWQDEDMVEHLLTKNADPKIGYPIHRAVNNLIITKKLLAKDKTLITQKDIHGNFPIHIAVSEGNIYVLKELIKLNKESVTALNNNGMTPLESFAQGNRYYNPKFLECLVNNGANINQRFQNGSTMLISAIFNSNLEMVLKVMDLKADINMPNSINQNTPLHFAVRYCRTPGTFEFVKYLVLHLNINLDLKNSNGETADQIMPFYDNNIEPVIAHKLIRWRREVNKFFKPDPKKPIPLVLSAFLKAIRTRDRSEVINAVPKEYMNMVIAYYDCYEDSNLWSTPELYMHS